MSEWVEFFVLVGGLLVLALVGAIVRDYAERHFWAEP